MKRKRTAKIRSSKARPLLGLVKNSLLQIGAPINIETVLFKERVPIGLQRSFPDEYAYLQALRQDRLAQALQARKDYHAFLAFDLPYWNDKKLALSPRRRKRNLDSRLSQAAVAWQARDELDDLYEEISARCGQARSEIIPRITLILMEICPLVLGLYHARRTVDSEDGNGPNTRTLRQLSRRIRAALDTISGFRPKVFPALEETFRLLVASLDAVVAPDGSIEKPHSKDPKDLNVMERTLLNRAGVLILNLLKRKDRDLPYSLVSRLLELNTLGLWKHNSHSRDRLRKAYKSLNKPAL